MNEEPQAAMSKGKISTCFVCKDDFMTIPKYYTMMGYDIILCDECSSEVGAIGPEHVRIFVNGLVDRVVFSSKKDRATRDINWEWNEKVKTFIPGEPVKEYYADGKCENGDIIIDSRFYRHDEYFLVKKRE